MSGPATIDTPFRPIEALRAVSRLLRDPEDTRQVFVVLSALRGRSGHRMFDRFRRSATGAAVLTDRRRLIDRLEDHAALARLPEGSLGRAYLDFMRAQNLSAAGLVEPSQVPEADRLGPDASLFRNRMRDMHDLTHVVTGYGRDGLGELCLLAFMFRQNGNAGGALIALMGMGKFPRGKAGRPLRAALFEGFRNGRKTGWLPEQDWEALLDQDLEDVRRRLGAVSPVAYRAVRP